VTADLAFFDCNAAMGTPTIALPGSAGAAASAAELLAAMDGYGIARALVWHVAQRDSSVPVGNRLLAEGLAGREARLTGCWSLLPASTGELPPPAEFFRTMAAANVRALRAFPEQGRFVLGRESCGALLGELVERRIPLILSQPSRAAWQETYGLLRDYPDLTCILADVGVWGADRYVRPLFDTYPHTYLEISQYFVDGGIEGMVGRHGADRLLFGTGFPVYHGGGGMLMLRHAEIPAAARNAIAGGNLAALLARARI